MHKVEILGRDFKQLVSEVTRFPGTGAFAGSDLVNLKCVDGYLTATSFGVVLAIGRKKAVGDMPLIAVDERALQNFIGVVSDGAPVILTTNGKELTLKSRKKIGSADLAAGAEHVAPELPEKKFVVDAESAETIRYLADIAFNDITRAELCCVMLTSNGKAMAMDQSCCAVLQTSVRVDGPTPLPLTLARAVSAGNSLYVGKKVTVLKAGCVMYSVPSMAKALSDYPFGVVKTLRKSSGNQIGEVKGAKLTEAIDDCLRCLGQLARTESMAELRLSPGVLRIHGANGGVRFDTKIAATACTEEKKFTAPLVALGRVRGFLSGVVVIAASPAGDLFLHLDNNAGWLTFSGEMGK